MKKLAILLPLLVAFSASGQLKDFFKKVPGIPIPGKVGEAIGVATNANSALKGATGIGLPEELTIGNSVSAQIISRFGGLSRDTNVTRRVNLMGKSLALYCERPDLNFQFGVLNSTTVNAFSAPGGYVFITRGLYDLIQNDDQLAGVLGHEIEHVAQRHALKIIERGQFLQGMSGLASFAGGAAGKDDLKNYSAAVGQLTDQIIQKGFDKDTEFAADAGGSGLAGMTGFAPDGLRQCLVELQKRETPQMTIFPTHPPLQSRIAKLPVAQAGTR
jgi:predicted Zn-dependent protease